MAAEIFDVAVIGAGMAGLTCAQALCQSDQNVIVLDKSRGVGGRMATRRLHDTRGRSWRLLPLTASEMRGSKSSFNQ